MQAIQDPIAAMKQVVNASFYDRAPHYDEQAVFPKENFVDLANAGLMAATISSQYGGLGLGHQHGNIYTLWKMVWEIAKADAATARCWEGHNNALVLLNNLATDSQKATWFKEIVEKGKIWGVWSGEPLVKKPGQKSPIGTHISKVPGGYRINGSKVFATSASGANMALLLVNEKGPGGARYAGDSPDTLIMLACDLSDPSVSYDDSWWNPIGMKASVSYKINFDDTFIPDEHLVGQPGEYLKGEWQTRFAPQYAANFAGVAEAAYEYSLNYINTQHRNDDPYVQQRLGKMYINNRTSDMWLRTVSDCWGTGDIESAKINGNAARYFIEQLATESMNHAIHICGARALIGKNSLERMHRDLSFYCRHDNDDHVLATVGKSAIGLPSDQSFYNHKPAVAPKEEKVKVGQ